MTGIKGVIAKLVKEGKEQGLEFNAVVVDGALLEDDPIEFVSVGTFCEIDDYEDTEFTQIVVLKSDLENEIYLAQIHGLKYEELEFTTDDGETDEEDYGNLGRRF